MHQIPVILTSDSETFPLIPFFFSSRVLENLSVFSQEELGTVSVQGASELFTSTRDPPGRADVRLEFSVVFHSL